MWRFYEADESTNILFTEASNFDFESPSCFNQINCYYFDNGIDI